MNNKKIKLMIIKKLKINFHLKKLNKIKFWIFNQVSCLIFNKYLIINRQIKTFLKKL